MTAQTATPAPVHSPDEPAVDTAPPRPERAGAGVAPALIVAVVLLLGLSVGRVDLTVIGGAGLAPLLPVTIWAAAACAALACAVEGLRSTPRTAVLTATTGALIAATTGVNSLVEGAARIPAAWVHSGFVSTIIDRGLLPAGVDARLGWAGFFAQWAWIGGASGTTDLDAVLRWAPPVIVAVWAAGVLTIARSLLGGRTRTAWAATWLFCGINWIEQDYFSPQATAIVMSLAAFSLVLGPLATRGRTGPAPDPRQVVLVWAVASIALVAVVVVHQLTPFALIAQLGILVLFRRFRGWWLVALLVVAEATWFVVAARDSWIAQLGLVTGEAGNVGQSLVAALFGRLEGDPGQLAVKAGRLALAASTWGLALAGAWIRFRRERDVVVVLLAAVPAGLVLVQSYGGEMLLRVVLYGLPFLAVLGAEALGAFARRWWRLARIVLPLGLVGLAVLLIALRGGNDAYVSVTPAELATTRSVLAAAPPGAVVLPLANAGPFGVSRAADVRQVSNSSECEELANDPVGCAEQQTADVILVLPSMDAAGVALEGRPPGWTVAAVDQLVATTRYRVAVREGLTAVVVRAVPR